ncbi:MAG: ATP-binding protein [Coxiellaceae bacterium]|nr:ATP-binding protein [Coxiellaceae bacterium]
MKNYFPTILATGTAFCNRTAELKHLLHNIEMRAPTLLVSPRRYGKTSLALKAIMQSKLPYADVDLYKALNEREIVEYILNGIARLLTQLENTPIKLMKLAASFFNQLQVKFAFSGVDIAIELSHKQHNAIELLLKALYQLDQLLLKSKRTKKAILLLDEFQIISEVTKNNALEAALREAMQKSQALMYIFAGSSRHLIELMFHDDSRPFFNSCDQITLHRISVEHYIKQINKAAKARWQQNCDTDAIEMIFAKTERHPYYVNKLCAILMRLDKPPTASVVELQWNQYRDENISRVQQEVSLLKLNQRRLLINLASDGYVRNPFSNAYSNQCDIAPTSIHRAMEFLLERDYVFCDDDNNYRVLDPLIKDVLML